MNEVSEMDTRNEMREMIETRITRYINELVEAARAAIAEAGHDSEEIAKVVDEAARIDELWAMYKEVR